MKRVALLIIVIFLAGCAQQHYEVKIEKPQIHMKEAEIDITEQILEPAMPKNDVVLPHVESPGFVSRGGDWSEAELLPNVIITARKYEYSPKEIRVKKGDYLRIALISEDVIHGIKFPYFDVRESILPDREKILEFEADEVGEFVFYNDMKSGRQYSKMRGVLIVED
jgi:hypothetical protein